MLHRHHTLRIAQEVISEVGVYVAPRVGEEAVGGLFGGSVDREGGCPLGVEI